MTRAADIVPGGEHGRWLAPALLVPITVVSLIGFIAPVVNLLVLSFQKAG